MSEAPIMMTVCRDYRTSTRYEFILYRGEAIVAREGFFATYAKAKRAALKAAQSINT
jgi:hypothetical protein